MAWILFSLDRVISPLRSDIWATMAIPKCALRLPRDSSGFANRAKRLGFLRQLKQMRGIGFRKDAWSSRWEAMWVCWRDRVKNWRRSSRSECVFVTGPQRADDEPEGKLADSDHGGCEHKRRGVRAGFGDQISR